MQSLAQINQKNQISQKRSLHELRPILQELKKMHAAMINILKIPKMKAWPQLACDSIWKYLNPQEILGTRLLNKETNNLIKSSLQSDRIFVLLFKGQSRGVDKAALKKVMSELIKNQARPYCTTEDEKKDHCDWGTSRSFNSFEKQIPQIFDKETLEKILLKYNKNISLLGHQYHSPAFLNLKNLELPRESQMILTEIFELKFHDYIHNSNPMRKLFWNFFYKAGFDQVENYKKGIGLNASGIGQILKIRINNTVANRICESFDDNKWNREIDPRIPNSLIKCFVREFLGQNDLDIKPLFDYCAKDWNQQMQNDFWEMINKAKELLHHKTLAYLDLNLQPKAWQLLQNAIENSNFIEVEDVLKHIESSEIKDHKSRPREDYLNKPMEIMKINIDIYHKSLSQMLQTRAEYLNIPSRLDIEYQIMPRLMSEYLPYIDFYMHQEGKYYKRLFDNTNLEDVFSSISTSAALIIFKCWFLRRDVALSIIFHSYLQQLPGHLVDGFIRPIEIVPIKELFGESTVEAGVKFIDTKPNIPLKDLKALLWFLMASGDTAEKSSDLLKVSFGLKYNYFFIINAYVENSIKSELKKYVQDEKMMYQVNRYIDKLIKNIASDIASDILDLNFVKPEERPDYAADQNMDVFEHAIQVVLDSQVNGDVKMPPQNFE
jgi:hypothetical protein